MPTIVKVIDGGNFAPNDALNGKTVTLNVTDPPGTTIKVSVNKSAGTQGVVSALLTQVLTTSAKHTELVSNLNTQQDVEVTIETNANNKVTDFSSRLASPMLLSAAELSAGASSDSAIPLT